MTEITTEHKKQTAEATRIQEVEPGESVSFTVGFDKKRFGQLNPDDLLNEQTWDKDLKIERLKDVLEVFAKLPEKMELSAGVTAIFGENGAGKTLLADVMIMALQMEMYRQEEGLDFEDKILQKNGRRFYQPLPGRLSSSGGSLNEQDQQREHQNLVAQIAVCMRVHEATVFATKHEMYFTDAHRSPAALGNVAIGMSTRQSIDYLKNDQRERRSRDEQPTVVLLDEPELGMSPRRQRSLIEELTQNPSGAVELVPSNSIVLFESDLPRIDLDVSEKGVHTP